MKKLIIAISSLFVLSGCNIFNIEPELTPVAGTWVNVMKYDKDTKVESSLSVTESTSKATGNEKAEKLFKVIMTSSLVGTANENVKVKNEKITVSGVRNGDILNISDVESDSESISVSSYFKLSKDGTLLTLYPGEIKFSKK
ncbi:MAG: membrane lipoprotein lipid attachment site-containing protein [Candidatus Sericytochromatia bacterium]